MSRIRTMVIDDEPLAREGIVGLLKDFPEIHVIGECGDGVHAIKEINTERPDIIFLDIQMPEVSGFDIVRALDSEYTPVVIFVTAFDQYAIDAFEAQALDYLLKPIDPERFRTSVKRAIAHINGGDYRIVHQQMTELLQHLQDGRSWSQRLLVKSSGKISFVKVSDIDWIGAAGDYVCVHAKKNEYLIRETMNSLEKKLDPSKFARIHRSTIVNIDRIKEIHPMFHGEFKIRLIDDTDLILSRSYRSRFEKAIKI